MESFENTVRWYICYWGEGWLVGSEIGNCSQHMFRTICLVLKLFLFFFIGSLLCKFWKGIIKAQTLICAIPVFRVFFLFWWYRISVLSRTCTFICGICLFWILKCFFIVFLVNKPFFVMNSDTGYRICVSKLFSFRRILSWCKYFQKFVKMISKIWFVWRHPPMRALP